MTAAEHGADEVAARIIADALDAVAPDEREAAKTLAAARQELAWRYADRPHWNDLTAAEQDSTTVEALHWLRAGRSIGWVQR